MIDALQDILLFNTESPLAFNSWQFWVLFTFFIIILGMVRKRKSVMLIYVIAFSAFFYYKVSGCFVVFLFVKGIVDFLLGRGLSCTHGIKKKCLLWFSILLSVGALVYCKYAGFLVDSFAVILERNFQPLDIIMPVGISFVTFQTISYFVDVYKGKFDGAKNVFEYLFYITFFPTIVSGPIVRAVHLLPQVRSCRKTTSAMVSDGFDLVILGLIKKAIIADYIAQYNNIVFSMGASYSGLEYMLALFGFSIQIYFDFSGYSDIAIGIARIMGFRLLPNFKNPYQSHNITDFWRRWHMSLSFWLRDYIYIPLGGNRCGKFRMYFNLLVTMIIGGIWHGAGLNFLVWGIIHGLGLIVQKMTAFIHLPFKRGIQFLSVILTFVFVSLAWLFFRVNDWEDICMITDSILYKFNMDMLVPFVEERTIWVIAFILSLILIFLPISWKKSMWKIYKRTNWLGKMILFIIVVQMIVQLSSVEVTQFIYSQF